MGPEAIRALQDLFSPASLAIMAGFIVAYIAAQITPVGWVADAIARASLSVAAIFLGRLLFEIVEDLYTFFSAVNSTPAEAPPTAPPGRGPARPPVSEPVPQTPPSPELGEGAMPGQLPLPAPVLPPRERPAEPDRVFAFGSRTAPRTPRAGRDLFPDPDGYIEPRTPPIGASTFGDVRFAPLTGHSHGVPKASVPAQPGLGIIADGRELEELTRPHTIRSFPRIGCCSPSSSASS